MQKMNKLFVVGIALLVPPIMVLILFLIIVAGNTALVVLSAWLEQLVPVEDMRSLVVLGISAWLFLAALSYHLIRDWQKWNAD